MKQLKFFTELFGYNSDIIDEFINRDIKNDEDILEGKCLLSNLIVQKEIESTEKNGDWKYKSRLLSFYKNELPKLQSGILVQLSSRTEGFSSDAFNKEYLECRGLIPDYWATTDSELEETLEYFCK